MKKTYTTQRIPYGTFTRNGHRLLCSDGKIRAAALAPTADTFFSVPASIRIKGRTISGYYTTETDYDFTPKQEFPAHAFRHHTYHDNKLPQWPEKFSPEHLAMVRFNGEETPCNP